MSRDHAPRGGAAGQPLECELTCRSSAGHLEQLYSGFGMLARRGALALRVRRAPDYTGAEYGAPLLDVVVRGGGAPPAGLRLRFDLWDHGDVPADLAGADVYLKRSFDPVAAGTVARADRVQPLGLNYCVYADEGFALRRALWARWPGDAARALVRRSRALSGLLRVQSSVHTSSVARMEGRPRLDAEPRVVFMARLWDPARVARDELREERQRINETRAGCVRLLRREFAGRFVGGLEPTPYALAHHADCVMSDARASHKGAYLRIVRESSIGVATVGLERSTGWKLAEYVAAARAIVSEPLCHALPGEFEPGRHYLPFRTPEECVARVGELMDSPERRLAMMRRNHAYYHGYVRPDALVWNALTTALAVARR